MATLRCLLHEAAGISAAQPALLDRQRSLSFVELEQRVARAALHLVNAGVRPGDRVLLRLANSLELLVLLLALPRTGAIAAPLNPRLPASAVLERAREIQATLLLTTRTENPELSPADIRTLAYEDLASFVEGPAEAGLRPEFALDAPHTLVFTSGSSGRPKPALLSFGNLYYSARGVNAALGVRSRDRWLLTLPLCHVSGLGALYRCLLAGATLALAQSGEELGEEILLYAATHVSLVPTQLARLLEHEDLPAIAAALKAILLGGAPCPPELLARARAAKLPVHPSYGMTEMASTITLAPAGLPAGLDPGSGRALPHREWRVREGEIEVRGPTLFLGYWRPEGAPDRPLTPDGWFATGDLGTSADEWLHVTGRRDNLFISGGENIHPETIERALCRHAGAAEALVVPIPDTRFGQRPVAFVRMRDPADDLGALADRLAPHLARHEIPDRFLPLPLAAGEGMKVDRAAFARLAARAAAQRP